MPKVSRGDPTLRRIARRNQALGIEPTCGKTSGFGCVATGSRSRQTDHKKLADVLRKQDRDRRGYSRRELRSSGSRLGEPSMALCRPR